MTTVLRRVSRAQTAAEFAIWWCPEVGAAAAAGVLAYAGLVVWWPLALLALPLVAAAVREPIRLVVSAHRDRQFIRPVPAAPEPVEPVREPVLELEEAGPTPVFAAAERLDQPLAIETGGR